MKICQTCGIPQEPEVAHGETCHRCHARTETVDGFYAYAAELAHESPGYKSEHFAQLAKLEAGNFWFRARNDLIVRTLARHFSDSRNFLEIGCGTGYVLAAIRQAFPLISLHGSEIFIDGLNYAKARVPGADLFQMDARAIPFREEFDLLGAFDVIEHIDDDNGVLKQIWGALKPRGGALFTVPQHMFLWSMQDEVACHVRRYARGELEAKLQATGFEIVYSTSLVTLLLPLMLLARRRGADANGAFDAYAEFRIPRLLDHSLYWTMRLERALISLGIRMPIGGTRLIAARKPG